MIGLGLNASFTNKVWNFVKDVIVSLENSYKKPKIQPKSNDEDSLSILKRHLVLGEITKEEYQELISIVDSSETVDTEKKLQTESGPKNYAKFV